jgi:trimeric autotransporter adhesin
MRSMTVAIFMSLVLLFAGAAWAGDESGTTTKYGDGAGTACTDNGSSFFGYYAGNTATGSNNTFLGNLAGQGASGPPNTGDLNTFVGAHCGMGNTTGTQNSFFGYESGNYNTSGSYNSFFGIWSGNKNSTGGFNVYIGYEACNTNQTGSKNTALGAQAGNNNTGDRNVFIGFQSGYTETGSNKLYIDNCYLGDEATCNKPLIYGEFDNRLLRIDGQLFIVSDERMKTNIAPLNTALDRIVNLKGVSYEWKDKARSGHGKEIGLLAQNVEKVFPELVHTDGRGYKAVSYDRLAPVLIEAIKEQNQLLTEQKKIISEQRAAITALQERLLRIENAGR